MNATTTIRKIQYKLVELPQVIELLKPLLQRYKILALHGNLGAGKTTFTAALCKSLGTNEPADSPTFSIINQYSFIAPQTGKEQLIFHSDWYRMGDEEEARMAGIEDMLNSEYHLCILEWTERAPELLDGFEVLHLTFELGNNTDERILIFD